MSVYAPLPTLASSNVPVYQPPSYSGDHELESDHGDDRSLSARTPSPTPSEVSALTPFDRKQLLDWRFWIRREWLWYYIIGAIVLAFIICFSVFETQIIKALLPAGTWMRKTPGGWVIPIAVLFIISFPPLFGQEIVILLCGIIWGLWIGFGIVAAGTILGEVANFYTFKYWCTGRGEKQERKSIFYACLAQVIREGGFVIALIVRFSAIPGHFATAIFATCGMGILVFLLAAVLSLPKQLVIVYLGVLLDEEATGGKTKTETIAKYSVLVVTIIMTMVAQHFIGSRVRQIKPQVIHNRRRARGLNKIGIPEFNDSEDSSLMHSAGPIPMSQIPPV